MSKKLESDLDKIEDELKSLSKENRTMINEHNNNMSIISSEHKIKLYEDQLSNLDHIANSHEKDLAIGYIGTGIAETTKGLCDKFINLVDVSTNNKGVKAVSTVYDKAQNTISAHYAETKEEAILHLSAVVIPDGDNYNKLKVLREASLAAIKNGDKEKLERLTYALKALAQSTKNPIAIAIINDMQANIDILKGLHTIGQYSDEKEAMQLKIAEEKAKLRYKIAREKEKINRLKAENNGAQEDNNTKQEAKEPNKLNEKITLLLKTINAV
jgi:hypothetical protein